MDTTMFSNNVNRIISLALDLERAVSLATKLHKDQIDKGGSPYIGHPLRVMKTILYRGYDVEVAIAAVLHDTVEDTPLTLDEVREQFGERVATIIDLVSKKPGDTYEQFIDRIIASGNQDAIHVKIADIEDNSDLSRLGGRESPNDKLRLIKYKNALYRLSN